ncbi:hypothetical protein Vretimale_8928, partial [Volvox reticuliferus]
LLRFQVLIAAATTNAAAASESRFGLLASASPRTAVICPQLLLSALSRCCGELLGAPRPPGLMGPSLALHACLGAMLACANQMPPQERAAAVSSGTTASAAAAAAATRVLPPDVRHAGPAARLDDLLFGLAAGPPLEPSGSGTPSRWQTYQPHNQQHGGAASPATEAMAAAAAAAACHCTDVLRFNPSWSRWWWAEAAQAEAFVAASVSGQQQRAAAAAAGHLHGGGDGGGPRGEAIGASDSSGSDSGSEDAESCNESDNNYDPGIGISTAGPGASIGDGDGQDGGPPTPVAVRYTAPARLCCAVRQLIWAEIRCTSTALLSSCFLVLTSRGRGSPRISRTAVPASGLGISMSTGPPDPHTNRSSFHGAFHDPYGDGCNRVPLCDRSDSEPVPFAPSPLLAEFSDAEFSFAPAPRGDEQTQQPAAAVAAPAALIASGCPALAAKLREMLLQPTQVVAGTVEAGGSRNGSGGSGDDGEGEHANTSSTADQEATSGRRGVGFAPAVEAAAVTVAPWPRRIQVQMGARVPHAAFRAVLEYLTQGFSLLPHKSAAVTGLVMATEPGAGAAAADQAARVREIAALASALGLTELHAVARGTIPRPGNVPPPVMPRLPPLFPHHLLLLPQPSSSPPPPLRPQHRGPLPQEQRQQRHESAASTGACEPAFNADMAAADKATGGSRELAVLSGINDPAGCCSDGLAGGGGPPADAEPAAGLVSQQLPRAPSQHRCSQLTPHSWPRHPPLEEQLAAIMRWEQEQDELSRLNPVTAPTTSNAGPTVLPRYIAVDAICLAGGHRTQGRCGGGGSGDDSGAGGGRGKGAQNGGGVNSWDCPCPWPADCVLAVPILRHYGSTMHQPVHIAATTVCAAGAAAEAGAAGTEEGVLSAAQDGATAEDDCGNDNNVWHSKRCITGGGHPGTYGLCRTAIIPAHRVVLASGSEYFAAAFSS